MESNTKKKIIISTSIVTTLLIVAGITTGIIINGKNTVKNTISSNDYGIGAFANLNSFDNNGLNNGIKKAGEKYLSSYKGNDYYFNNKEKKVLEKKTTFYTDDGREYVSLLNDYFSSNDIVISSGFQFGNAVTGIENSFDGVFTDMNGNDTIYANSNDKAVVLLDDESLATKYSNVSSVSFAAEGAGYLAAQIAWLYTQYDAATNHSGDVDYTPNVVMWGGKNFPTVYDYMSGFAQGITELNETYVGVEIGDEGYKTQSVILWSGGLKNNETITSSNSYDISKLNSSEDARTWYSGGFDASTEQSTNGVSAQTKTKNAINNKASVVFPIAGGNTEVAENTLINSNTNSTKIIGVDADGTISSSHDELYIASAEKNLVDGGAIALWSMDDFDNDGIRNYADDINENDNLGIELVNNGIIDEWRVETTTSDEVVVGTEFRGTIYNGGVDLIYGSEQAGGKDNLKGMFSFYGYDETQFKKYLESLSSDAEIINNDGNFTNVNWT